MSLTSAVGVSVHVQIGGGQICWKLFAKRPRRRVETVQVDILEGI